MSYFRDSEGHSAPAACQGLFEPDPQSTLPEGSRERHYDAPAECVADHSQRWAAAGGEATEEDGQGLLARTSDDQLQPARRTAGCYPERLIKRLERFTQPVGRIPMGRVNQGLLTQYYPPPVAKFKKYTDYQGRPCLSVTLNMPWV